MKRISQSGDTIVEVLIAIIVVSVVLGAAYVSAHQTLNSNRQAEERAQALKFLQGQVEQIKANTAAAYSQSAAFCYASNGSGIVSAGNALCTTGSIPGGYRLSVAPQVGNTYSVKAVWDSADGSGTENIVISYRVYQ